MNEQKEDRPSVLRETDDEAIGLARSLLRSARSCALAVIEPETQFPFASRTLTGIDVDGVPVILVSGLSVHTRALRRDGRSSLLAGEPGKGDPLAHPRLTVLAKAEEVSRESTVYARLRERFVRRHPKAKLYVDFPDFVFFRLVPAQAHLNGGFGKAYVLTRGDLMIGSPACLSLAEIESASIDHMNADHADAVGLYATRLCKAQPGNWKLTAIDAAGLDLSLGDELVRLAFEQEIQDPMELRPLLVRLATEARSGS
ncbi:HugZ family protein [Sinorhizobium sp. BG8]|uniref:HugZ family pyridoxamine 5'-phosphate oxidase n=1 Tax=Sinorhizobium sp. BG8 TaxID=2613773 RepID=UPI00193D54B1|nr:HugZ family protein [Sinorhizobium sp. BG8]QRM56345.1 HugZ family protein [Sinorhizobium sp. BG8]